MPVIDELYIRNKDGLLPVDSIEDKMLDEIVVGGQSYHFAKESAASDVNNVVCDNAVEEPLTGIVAIGNTTQEGKPSYNAPQPIVNFSQKHEEIIANCKNLINPDKFAEIIISKKGNHIAEIIEVDGRRCIRYMNSTTAGQDLTACISEPFKEKTRYIFSFEAKPYTIVPESNTYNGHLWMGFKPSGTYTQTGLNGKTTTEFTRTTCLSYSNSTVSDINLSWGSMHYWLIDLDSIYLYEYQGNSNPDWMPHHTIDEYKDEWEELEVSGANLFTPDLFVKKSTYMSVVSQRDGDAAHITGTATGGIYTNLVSTNADGRAGMPASWYGKTLTFASFGNSTDIEFGFYYFNEETQKWTLKTYGTCKPNNNHKFKVSLTTETKFWARVRHVKDHVYDDYVKIICVEGDYTNKDLPYEPYYEPQTVKIPPKIDNLTLRFAKFEDTYDSLEVDGIAKTVIYKQRLDEVIVGPNLWTTKYSYAGVLGIDGGNILPYAKCARQKGFCSFARPIQLNGSLAYQTGGVWLGVNSNYIFWIGIISALGYNADWADKLNPTTEEWTAARDKFRAWLREHEANGNPFKCIYVIPTADIKDHDITDTEFGQELLALAANKGTNYIKITGDTSSLGVGYWRQVIPDEEI